MRLFICEKPSQAVNLAPIIGATNRKDGYAKSENEQIFITWCVGHLLEPAAPEEYDDVYKSWSIENLPIIPSKWKMNVKKSTAKQFEIINKLIKIANEVVIATDIDREGETIAWELLERFNWKGATLRLWSSSNNYDALKKALANIQDAKKTYSLYQAGRGRAQADWLVGMNFTRLYTTLAKMNGFVGKILSVGRVQTPTLNLIVMRDQEIKNFVPKPYWGIIISIKKNGQQFNAYWKPSNDICDDEGRCIDQQIAKQKASTIQQNSARVISVETKRTKSQHPLCLSLNELQTQCNKLFGMDLQQTLNTAQSLYEKHTAITYPRTDCGYLQIEMLKEVPLIMNTLIKTDPTIKDVINCLNFNIVSKTWDDSKITAHHGIIPTTQAINLESLSDNERKVYELIRTYYLSQFLPFYEVDKTMVQFDCSGECFISRGEQIVELGWRKLFIKNNDGDSGDDQNQKLPILAKDENCIIEKLELQQKESSPPKPYTDASLLNAMINVARFVNDPKLKQLLNENSGLGTEATRASIIETLLNRGYIERKKKNIISTILGQSLINSLPDIVKNPGMTALWEQDLKNIELGKNDLNSFMVKQASFINMVINYTKNTSITIEQSGIKCPQCNAVMIKRTGEHEDFWGCSKYPKCKGLVKVKFAKQKSK